MRRKTGIVIGTCAALALAGTGGAVVAAQDGEDPAGWHEAPAIAPAPVTEHGLVPGATVPRAPRTTAATPSPSVTADTPERQSSPSAAPPTPRHVQDRRWESTEAPASGRERVGTLHRVDEEVGYPSGPVRQELSYPGASYVKVHFERIAVPAGDYVTVSNPAGTESYRYEADTDGRWAMSITGDTAVVEVHRRTESLNSVLAGAGVDIDRVARGDARETGGSGGGAPRPARPGAPGPAGPGREESVCGTDTSTDAVCYESNDPVAYTKSKAIARLLINGTELCTGWRVGAKNRMITNNHCLTNSAEAYDTEVWFNYQCAKCGGYDVFKPTKVWGDKVLATDKTYDYTLFTVDGFASIEKFGFLTLDPARPKRGQELYVPQHPAGEPARIAGSKGEAAGNCAVDNPDYTGYAAHSDVSYFCDTAGGSSGSPVISRATNRVVALHHFGGCPNSGVRGDLLAGRLRAYL
ncbi:trypsin-like peptidase domain-containing protein [Actinoplanes philippinensis]|uniref:trypsin-like peptidase domain-containing protein n=1 Tax=Actinoplanes philippinensis TaxID=35752 RepID=UPI0033E374AF